MQITPVTQTNPSDYYYTGNNPVASFTKTNFTTNPVDCANYLDYTYECPTSSAGTDSCGNLSEWLVTTTGLTFDTQDINKWVPGTLTITIIGKF